MKSHQLAKLLLELPDVPVVIDMGQENGEPTAFHEVTRPVFQEDILYDDINCRITTNNVITFSII